MRRQSTTENRYSYREYIGTVYGWQGNDTVKIKEGHYETNVRNRTNIWLSNLEQDANGNIIELSRLTSYGDYNNSCMVERSNYETVKEYLKENKIRFFNVTGGYGYNGIYVKYSDYESNDVIRELLEDLDNYLLFDEDSYSELTWESYQDQWESDGAGDFSRELCNEFKLSDTIREKLSERDNLQEFYESLLPSGEWYYDESPSGVYILVSDAVKNCTRAQLAEYLYNKDHRAQLPIKLADIKAAKLQLPLPGIV